MLLKNFALVKRRPKERAGLFFSSAQHPKELLYLENWAPYLLKENGGLIWKPNFNVLCKKTQKTRKQIERRIMIMGTQPYFAQTKPSETEFPCLASSKVRARACSSGPPILQWGADLESLNPPRH